MPVFACGRGAGRKIRASLKEIRFFLHMKREVHQIIRLIEHE
jgi:hypothetical protein